MANLKLNEVNSAALQHRPGPAQNLVVKTLGIHLQEVQAGNPVLQAVMVNRADFNHLLPRDCDARSRRHRESCAARGFATAQEGGSASHVAQR